MDLAFVICTKLLSIELYELISLKNNFRRNDFACKKFGKNNIAAPAESTEVREFEDDISSDSTVVTLSTFTIDFGGDQEWPKLTRRFSAVQKEETGM